MNRIIAGFLAVALLAALAGCGQKAEDPGNGPTSGTEQFDKKEVPNRDSSRRAAPD